MSARGRARIERHGANHSPWGSDPLEGYLQRITSVDGTITVSNPTGPTVDLVNPQHPIYANVLFGPDWITGYTNPAAGSPDEAKIPVTVRANTGFNIAESDGVIQIEEDGLYKLDMFMDLVPSATASVTAAAAVSSAWFGADVNPHYFVQETLHNQDNYRSINVVAAMEEGDEIELVVAADSGADVTIHGYFSIYSIMRGTVPVS